MSNKSDSLPKFVRLYKHVFGGDTVNSPPLLRFAGNMERQQADNLLKSHSSGTYLIRERTAEAERFAISIK